MKKLLLGTIIGIGAACLYRNMKENGQLDRLTEEANDLACRAKTKLKDSLEKGLYKAEEVKDEVESKVDKGFEKGKEALNKSTY